MIAINEPQAEDVRTQFEEYVRDRAFPCVGAKSALSRGTLKTVVCRSIASGWDDVRIHRELLDWAREKGADPAVFKSIAFVFAQSPELDEEGFEAAMWERIQSLSDKDVWLGQKYDQRVSSDPDDPHFSLSFGGEAFFVVGMHPRASRVARRTPWPVLVFNLHAQFETLREDGRYETIRAAILDRDEALAGSVNPMLARHGDESEAGQYSGRQVDADWKCPFRDKRADA